MITMKVLARMFVICIVLGLTLSKFLRFIPEEDNSSDWLINLSWNFLVLFFGFPIYRKFINYSAKKFPETFLAKKILG